MTVAANGSNSPVELKAQMAELKQAIADSIKSKADQATVTKLQTQLDALDISLANRHGSGFVEQKSIVDVFQRKRKRQPIAARQKG